MPRFWWLKRRSYFMYVIRDLSPTAGVAWLVIFLFQIHRIKDGVQSYEALFSPWYVAFSLICLLFTLLHAFTWFGLSGVALPLRIGGHALKARTITVGMASAFVVVSAIVGFLLVWLAGR